MSNNKNKTSTELYVNIEVPDNRKRLTIIYEKNENEKESFVLFANNNLTFPSFLGQIINKFNLESNVRSKIRVKTNGRRIKNLRNVYNNQVFNFTISDLVDEDPEDENTSERALTKSEEDQHFQEDIKLRKKKADSEYLQLYKSSNSNRNLFYNEIIRPLLDNQISNQRIVIVGESYPYRVKVILFDTNKDSRIVLYFIESPTSSLEYTYKVFIEENKKKSNLTNDIQDILKEEYESNKSNILNIINKIEELYKKNAPNIVHYQKSAETIDLFSELKTVETESQNVVVSGIYSKTERVSTLYDIPYSLSKSLLWQNKFEIKLIGDGEEKNKAVIRSLSFPHKAKDISLYRFKSLVEELPDGGQIECPICFCDYNKEETIELICGHRYCNGCITQYFSTSVNDGNGNRIQINCPHLGCLNKCIDEVTIETCLSTSAQTSNLLKGMIIDYTFEVPNTFFCPEPGCGRVISNLRSTTNMVPYVHCDLHYFCLFCKKPGYHWPLSCKGTSPDSSEIFNIKYILENTTICSKCSFPIEKNQGCDHMTCSRCRYEFCYRCGSKYGYLHDCDSSQKAKVKFFFNTVSGKCFDIDVSFMEEFFKRGDFQSHDPLINHLYRSFVNIFTERKFKCKKHLKLLEGAIFSLHALNNHTSKSMEKFSIQQCKSALKRLLRDNNIHLSYLSRYDGPKIRSLSANICLNGSKKALAHIFVNSQFPDFKQEIANQLNKLAVAQNEPFDAKKLRVYNIYGGQIKNSLEILDGEPLFISRSINEPFIVPELPTLTPEEIEEAKKKIEQESEKEVVIKLGTFTQLRNKKDKRKQDLSKLIERETTQLKIQEQLINDQQLNTNNSNGDNDQVVDENNSKVIDQYSYYYKNQIGTQDESDESEDGDESEDEDDISELLFNEFINIESGSSSSEFEDDDDDIKEVKQLIQQQETIDKEQKQIELVMKVLEYFQDDCNNGLDFDKVFSLVSQAKNFSHAVKLVTKYLDEAVYSKQYGLSQQHLLMKEVLIDKYPHVSHNVIDNAIKESNYNIEKAKQWILHKFIKQQKRKQKQQLNNNNNNISNNNNSSTQNNLASNNNNNSDINQYYADIIEEDEEEYYDDEYDNEEDKITTKLHPRHHNSWY